MTTEKIDSVSVTTQANVYFDGKCVSHNITLANGSKASVGVGYQLFRKAKWAFKKIKGTQGVHRNEAAALLYAAATSGQGTDKLAATAALLISLGAAAEDVMASPERAVSRSAGRIKSV